MKKEVFALLREKNGSWLLFSSSYYFGKKNYMESTTYVDFDWIPIFPAQSGLLASIVSRSLRSFAEFPGGQNTTAGREGVWFASETLRQGLHWFPVAPPRRSGRVPRSFVPANLLTASLRLLTRD